MSACASTMFDLEGKVAVVTGGAKGIGAAAIRSILDEGAEFVAFIDVDEISGITLEQELVKKHGKKLLKFFKCDVTSDADLFHVFDYTVKHHGYIDLVVNNAAIGDDAKYKKEIEINFTAVVTSTLKALEMMRKDRGGAGGTIINISSLGALAIQKDPSLYVYCATKSAVLHFSTNLGMEGYYTHTGVRVITLCFGLTSTDIIANLKGIDDLCTTEMYKTLDTITSQRPEAAAAGIVEAFKKGKSGSTWLVIDGQIMDITEKVLKGYQVMLEEIQI